MHWESQKIKLKIKNLQGKHNHLKMYPKQQN